MNIIDNIENQIAANLQTIDMTAMTTYKYKTYCGTVNVWDDTISIAENANDIELPSIERVVNYEVEQYDDEQEVDFTVGAMAMTNEVTYRIRCRVHNKGDEQAPKRAITTRMNDVLSDLKFAFANDYNLHRKCESFLYKSSSKNYSVNDDLINTGYIDIYFQLIYSQDTTNPDETGCY